MLQKVNHQNVAYCGPAPEGTLALEREGHHLLEGEYSADEVAELVEDIERVYRRVRPDGRWGRPTRENAAMFRYEMFNRSAICQRAIARPGTLAILEPLLGADCHVISCTAWRNPPGEADAPNGIEWHVDGGPHVPRPAGIEWPARIPYPIFVVATHLWLREVGLDDGPHVDHPRQPYLGRAATERADSRRGTRLWWSGRRPPRCSAGRRELLRIRRVAPAAAAIAGVTGPLLPADELRAA